MKALIFNSGTGNRMGEMTKDRPKCLVELPDGETILSRQLRILAECGINDVIITTGKYTEMIADEVAKNKSVNAVFVENPRYSETNYIYSMHLAAPHFDDDILMLHGDLVFDRDVVDRLLNCEHPDACTVSIYDEPPEKDFKCRVISGCLAMVSVDIMGGDCFAFQPMYKLSRAKVNLWADKVSEFVKSGKTSVYAENALNELLPEMDIRTVSYDGCYIQEIDNEEDLLRVGAEIVLRDLGCKTSISELPDLIESIGCIRPFAVVGRHFEEEFLCIMDGFEVCCFTDYRENPDDLTIKKAADAFAEYGGDVIISVGGGSVIDTAKGVKSLNNSNVPHISVPTTAGSGSESTKFAVYYKDGIKQSMDRDELLPEHIIADSRLLITLDRRQRTVTLLDALCHSAESLLSVGANDESRRYSHLSIGLIKRYFRRYIGGDDSVNGVILTASNYAGRAINISRTSAGHAMSYVLTSRFGIKHGQAVAICLRNVLDVLSESGRMPGGFDEINRLLADILAMGDFRPDERFSQISAAELAKEVNADRMKNMPIKLSEEDILEIYDRVITELRG